MSNELSKRKVKSPAHVKPKRTVTPYQTFKKEVTRLLDKSNMGGGWKIYFDCRDIGTGDASTEWHMTHRWVEFVFNSNRKNKLSISESKLTAKHEFGHFVTCRLERLAVYRFTTEDEIREEMEAIARVFEKIA